MRNPDLQHHWMNLVDERKFAYSQSCYVEVDVLKELADDVDAILDERATEKEIIAIYERKVKLYQMEIGVLQAYIARRHEAQGEESHQ